MQTSEWTACIPVRNEEKTLARTVTSIRNQTASNSLVSILIGANACNDNTVKIARDLSRQDSRIQVIESPIPGKARMWNTLFNQAPTNNILFTDGDVVLHEKAAEKLLSEITNGDNLAIAAGNIVPYIADLPLRLRLLNRSYIPTRLVAKPYISGPLYLMNCKRTDELLRKKGFDKMPIKLLGEDEWLGRVLYPNWVSIGDAVAFCRPYAFTEEFGMSKRFNTSWEQLKLYGNATKLYPRPTISTIKRIIEERPTPLSLLTFTACHLFYKILKKATPKSMLPRANPDYWYQSQYSKIPLPDGLEFSKLN